MDPSDNFDRIVYPDNTIMGNAMYLDDEDLNEEWYEIDFDKVKTLKDVIIILQGLEIGLGSLYLENHPELTPYIKKIEE